MRAADLPADPTELSRRTVELVQTHDPVALENALVVIDKWLSIVSPKGASSTPASYEPAWRGAEASFWLANLAEADKHRRAWFADKGIAYGKAAVAARPDGVEGHYFLALDSANLARTRTIGALELLPGVLQEGKAAIAAGAKFDHCGPLRLVGTLLLRAPSWPTSIGDVEESLDNLTRAVTECPEHPGNQLFYGEALMANKHRDQAAAPIEKALAIPTHPDWAALEPAIRKEAAEQLEKLKK